MTCNPQKPHVARSGESPGDPSFYKQNFDYRHQEQQILNHMEKVENGNPLRMKGGFLTILVREGDAWKTKVDTYNFTGPPVPAETK